MTLTATMDMGRFPDMDDINALSAGVNFTFDTSTDVLAAVFRIPATGTISNVHYRVATSTTPSLTLRCELRTVDAATGLPSAAGTLYGSSTSITSANPTTGNKTAAVNCTGATMGDIVALVFDLSAYTSGSIALVERIGGALPYATNLPYTVSNTTGATSLIAHAFNNFALEYGTDTYYPLELNTCCGSGITTATVSNSGVTRRGNRIRSTVPRRAVGMYVYGDLDGDCFLRLRLASDDSLLATATADKDIRGTTAIAVHRLLFDSAATVSLTAGTDYYALIEGNSATTCSISFLQNVPENAQLDQLSGGKNCYGTSYNAGYTDVNTARYVIGILYDQLDDGAGASGLAANPIAGFVA